MKNSNQDKPDEYFVINPDGSESTLHVDYFTNPPARSKNPKRIQIVNVGDGRYHKTFQEELQQYFAENQSNILSSFETKH